MGFTENVYDRIEADIREDYFAWLCELIDSDTFVADDYGYLLRQLFDTEFEYSMRMDENRKADGEYLREEFKNMTGSNDYGALSFPCTILEMIIGVAGRMDYELCNTFEDYDERPLYFAELMRNLGLDRYTDEMYAQRNMHSGEKVRHILADLCDRTYEPDGKGSLFPMNDPGCDMRQMEIWDQMHNYIRERGL